MSTDHDHWREHLAAELDGVGIYEGLARLETDPARAASLLAIADDERRHAAIWEKRLIKAGQPIPPFKPSARSRLILQTARLFGPQRVYGFVIEMETNAVGRYGTTDPESAAIAADEAGHRDTLGALRNNAPATPRAHIAEREAWHRGRSGSLRAAVFGINDGIVSNLSLVLGVAGAGVDTHTLLITGVSGLLAGASAMAAGEYVSVASHRDLLTRQIELERRELQDAPEEEREELIRLMAAKGLSDDEATALVDRLMQDPVAALDTIVREELGLDPEDLGSPYGAAGASFVMFAVGAIIPLVPFVLLPGASAAPVSVALTLAVLAGVGGLLGTLSGTGAWWSAIRMAGLAALAAGLTWGLGHLVGAQLD